MIFNETIPTKGNLINLKEQYKLAKQGHNLLEKKRNIILRELVSLIERAASIQTEILETFEEAYKALQLASLDIGMESIEEISKSILVYDGLKIRFRSIMGVEIPEIYKEEELISKEIPYGIYRTNPSLDKAYIAFRKTMDLMAMVAQIENAVYRLAYEAKRTRKRVNSLENIVIPQLEISIKSIQETLEELERDEFFKLKLLKTKK